MSTKIERLFTFMMKEKTRKIFAFAYYVFFIVMLVEIDLPLALQIVHIIVIMIITLLGSAVYMSEWLYNMHERNRGKRGKKIIQEIKKIAKEILMFIPILLISGCITAFIAVGQPVNQINTEQAFYESPIYISILAIIIGPIIEEFIFRLLPYKFIKNKTLYIIISTVVFAAMHVINDTNPFYYVWFYMIRAFYYGYRYHKTKDILVPISIHSFNNFISILLLALS